MFGFSAKLPVSEEQRLWVDEAFERLVRMLGRERMLRVEVVLPEDRFFPDRYDGTATGAVTMASRIAKYMGVAPESFHVEIYAEGEEALHKSVPFWSRETNDAAGLYFHEPEAGPHTVGIHAKQLGDPLNLAATLAHELAHVLLLGGGLLDREVDDMEPLTEVATVFLGMGFLRASAAFQFKQWTDTGSQGWRWSRSGYLSEELWGYSLARFARERGETKPSWAKGLPSNVRTYFERSARCLEKA